MGVPKSKLLRAAAHIVAEKIMVVDYHSDPAVVQYRENTCRNCGHNKAGECTLCGCFLDIKVKTFSDRSKGLGKIVLTHCPDGKWADRETKEFYSN